MTDASPDSRRSAEELRAHQLAWGQAWLNRDPDAVLAGYAPQAVLLTPNRPPVRGRQEFDPFIRWVLSNPDFSLAWAVEEARVSDGGDLGYVWGSYVQHNPLRDGPGHTVETGVYMTTFERRDGRWQALVEINTPGDPKT